MKRLDSRPRLLALAVAAVLVIAGVLLAVLGGGHSQAERSVAAVGRVRLGNSGGGSGGGGGNGVRAPGYLAVAADYLGLPRPELRRDLRSGRSLAQIADSTSGRSSTVLIDRLVQTRAAALAASHRALTPARRKAQLDALRARMTALANRRRVAAVAAVAADLHAAAGYLGLDPARLRSELGAGRTLAQIADATAGRSSAGLVAALVATRRARLAAAVAAGRVPPKREAHLASSLRARVTAEVNGSRKRR
jgi:hypothetical protein